MRRADHETWRVDENGCWVWLLNINPDGYGHVGRDGFKGGAHRWMWLRSKGPIPPGLTIDHLCRNRACVNTDHMELVTIGENVRRGQGVTAANGMKERCKRGHPFDPENTYHYTRAGHPVRACRTCNRQRSYAYYVALRAEALTT